MKPKNIFTKGHIPWNKELGKATKVCMNCKREFTSLISHHRKFCTKKCYLSQITPWNKDKTGVYSDEVRKNMSLHMKGRKSWNKGIPHLGKGKIKWQQIQLMGTKSQSSKKTTSIEKKVYGELKRRGIIYEQQKCIGDRYIVDAYIPSLNLVIEADGDYWHSIPKVKERDERKNEYIKECGFGLVRWTETDINKNITNLFDQLTSN